MDSNQNLLDKYISILSLTHRVSSRFLKFGQILTQGLSTLPTHLGFHSVD